MTNETPAGSEQDKPTQPQLGGAAQSQEKSSKKKPGKDKNAEAKPGRHTRMMEMPGLLKYVDFDYGEFMRRRNVRVLFALIFVVIALLFGYWLRSVFVPLIAALMLAYILNPLVVWLQRKGLSRHRAVLAIFGSFFSLALLMMVLIVPVLISNLTKISKSSESYPQQINAGMASSVAWVNGYLPEDMKLDPSGFKMEMLMGSALGSPPSDASEVTPAPDEPKTPAGGEPDPKSPDASASTDPGETAAAAATRDANTISAEEVKQVAKSDSMRAALDLLGSALNVLLFITLLPLYTFYFMLGLSGIWDRFVGYIPPRKKKRILGVLGEIHSMLSAFFRGRLIICLIISLLTTTLFLSFGVPFAVLLGLVGGFGVIIPFFSMIASLGPALLLMSMTSGATSTEIIAVGLIFSAIMGFEQYMLTPKILGKAVELHPVTLLVGVFVMAHLFGVFGALMAVPLTALAKILGRELIFPYFRALVEDGEGVELARAQAAGAGAPSDSPPATEG